jgi:hypothetical protein
MYAIEMASCGIPSFMKMGTGVKAILKIFFRNLRGCNIGIACGRNILITPLMWTQA